MIDIFDGMTTLQILNIYLPKIIVATLCGGVVGIERERKHKAAGMKTNIMVCVGAAIFATTAFLISSITRDSDPTRMVGQIITGIGFLGAGAIFKDQEKVRGLTSAALIWILGAIGIMIAAGGYLISMILTSGLVVLIWSLVRIEKIWFKTNGDHD